MPLPQRILSVLLDGVLAANRNDDTGTVLGSEDLSILAQSAVFFDREFRPAFERATGAASPTKLETERVSLLGLLREFEARLPDALKDGDCTAIAEMAQVAKTRLADGVRSFLGALFDAVVAHEKASARRMKDVDNSSLSQIDEIAQTINFIAINASVEAARAGDAGKGFAVISTQIRELSQKAKSAVDTIRDEFA